jgi:hypothetical protein
MKILSVLSPVVLAILVAGCATQKQVSTLEGRGTKRVYNATFDQTWRAAIDASQRNSLEIADADRAAGYISAHRTIQPHTFGENVGIWVREVAAGQTEVEVVSRQAGPPVAWLKNWENEIQRSIAANLTREVPAIGTAPRETIIERGDGSRTIIVPETPPSTTVAVPDPRREQLRENQRILDELRFKREAGQRALTAEVDETKRDILHRGLEQLNEDIRLQQQRVHDLEQQVR